MNLVKFLEDYSIPHTVNTKRGWTELQCPFCDDHSQNLGYNMEKDYFSCWRCGGHRVIDTVCRLANVTTQAGSVIIRSYSSGPSFTTKEVIRIGVKKVFKYPSSVGNLQRQHIKYLENRGFNAEKIVEEWRVMGTGPVAPLDHIDYKHRIVIPITWQNRVVSFQTRDITGKHKLRYLACPKDRELVNHQSIVYMHPECDTREWVVLVEGVTDAWRLGRQAVATFGISISADQVKSIASTFKKVILMFDREPQAQISARALIGELRFRGVQCQSKHLPDKIKDPALLSDAEAQRIMAEVENALPSI